MLVVIVVKNKIHGFAKSLSLVMFVGKFQIERKKVRNEGLTNGLSVHTHTPSDV